MDRQRPEIVFETARLYLKTLAYTDLIEAAQSRIECLRPLLVRTNRLVQGERAVPVDALKIQTQLAQVESDLATLKSGRRTALSGLAAVMGFDRDLPQLTYTPAPSQLGAPVGDEAGLLRQAVAERPEIFMLDREVSAAERTAEAIRKSALPRIDFRASAAQYGSHSPIGFTQLIGSLVPALGANATSPENGVIDWVVGARVTLPPFNGHRPKGQFQAALAQLQQSRLAGHELRLRTSREVRTAMAASWKAPITESNRCATP